MTVPHPPVPKRMLVHILLRVAASFGAIMLLYFVLPMDDGLDWQPLLFLALGLLGLAVLLGFQVRMILTSSTPGLRAIEALAVTVPLLVCLFASIYYVASYNSATAFNESLTKIDALYFTVTTFSTTGYGDIAAKSQAMRVLATMQMGIDLIVIGFGIRIVLNAVQIGRARSGAVTIEAD